MAKLSDKKAASLKFTFDRLTSKNNENLTKLESAISLGGKQFNDARLDIIENKLKQKKDDALTFSGFLFDVALAFVLGPLAGVLVAEATEFLLRPSVRSRLTILHPISHANATRSKSKSKASEILEIGEKEQRGLIDVFDKPVQPSVSIAETVPELEDWERAIMGMPAATTAGTTAARAAKPKENPLPNDFFDLTTQSIEHADTASFKAFTDDWVFEAVSNVASDEARDRLPAAKDANGGAGQVASVTMPKGMDAGALFTTQCEVYLNQQRYRNLATQQLLEWLLDAGMVGEFLGGFIQLTADGMLEHAKNTADSFTMSMIARQARVIEAILWVLWLKEQSGKALTFDKDGYPHGGAVETLVEKHDSGMDWKIEREYVDYWITNLINPWDDAGRTFLDESGEFAEGVVQKYKGREDEYFKKYPYGTLKKDELARRGAETSLFTYFNRIEWDLQTQNRSGEKLMSIARGAS